MERDIRFIEIWLVISSLLVVALIFYGHYDTHYGKTYKLKEEAITYVEQFDGNSNATIKRTNSPQGLYIIMSGDNYYDAKITRKGIYYIIANGKNIYIENNL